MTLVADTETPQLELSPRELANMDGLRFEVLYVTPAMAKRWLETNIENNRIVRESKVDLYVSDMRGGRWRNTGETIKFNPDGKLIDGQHRLQALIESGVSGVTMSIAFDVPNDALEVIDTGAARRFADTLKMQEAVNRFASAAIVRRTLQRERGNPTGMKGRSAVLAVPTNAEMLARYRQDPGGFDAAAARGYDFSRLRMCSATGAGIMAYWLNAIAPEEAHQFMDQVVSGADIGKKHPANVLRTRLFRERALETTQVMALFIRAWNFWCLGNTLDRIQTTRKGELNNGNFPEPITPRKFAGDFSRHSEIDDDEEDALLNVA